MKEGHSGEASQGGERRPLRFSDGMEFDLSGELHLERRSDGWYVVGRGMLIPVEGREEGAELIERMQRRGG